MSSALTPRQLKHIRTITVEAYSRDDGLWDVEARLTDHKTRDFPLASGVRRVGDAIHRMTLSVTVDTALNVRDAHAESLDVPYPGSCQAITPAYNKLIGLNLMQGFRQAVKERLGGVAGCTHLTELAAVLPTATIQAFAGEVLPTRDGGAQAPSDKPFQLDRCHGLRTDGDAVREFYPQWYRTNSSES